MMKKRFTPLPIPKRIAGYLTIGIETGHSCDGFFQPF